MNKLYLSKKWMEQRYKTDGMSCADIARICGVTEMTINRQLVKFGLMPRTRMKK